MDDFHSTMQTIEALFNGLFSRAQFIWLLVGGIIILCGLVMLGLTSVYRVKGHKVMLKVIHLHEEERRIKDDDDEERIAEKKANPWMSPEFEVMDGPHQGTRNKSSSGGAEHKLGEVVPGYFIPQSGDVTSQLEIQRATRFGLLLVAIGVVFIVGTQLIAASWGG